jgi:hypothetical protein
MAVMKASQEKIEAMMESCLEGLEATDLEADPPSRSIGKSLRKR